MGDRLKEERTRLGLSQTAFAALGGLTKHAQIQFEQDKHLPGGAYLIGVASVGVDVQYVLTGIRSLNAPGAEALRRDEQVLLEKYRALPPPEQTQVQAELAAPDAGIKTREKRQVKK